MDALDLAELAKLLDEAAERGAKRALEKVGLHDDEAGSDIRDLRTLIDGWRTTKKAVGHAIVNWATIGLLGFLSALVYFKFGGSK